MKYKEKDWKQRGEKEKGMKKYGSSEKYKFIQTSDWKELNNKKNLKSGEVRSIQAYYMSCSSSKCGIIRCRLVDFHYLFPHIKG